MSILQARCSTFCLTAAWLTLAPASFAQCVGGLCRPDDAPPPAVVRIVNETAGSASYGSGTLVARDGGQGLVLTCAHLFREGAGRITVCFPSGLRAPGKLLGADAAWDLAAIEVEAPPVAPVAVAEKTPQVGEPLSSCGYGPDGAFRCNRGRALGYSRVGRNPGHETLTLSGSARQGDSGGPVLNAGGELVAVLWGTDGRTVEGTYCGRILKFLAGIAWRASPLTPAAPVVPPPVPSIEPPAKTEPPPAAAADTKNAPSLRETVRDFAVGLLIERGPGLLEAALPGLLAALGWTGPPVIAAIIGLKLLLAILRRRAARRAASTDAAAVQETPPDQPPLSDDYAAQLAQVFALSGHSTLADATLGRTYDEELRQAEQSSDAALARWAKLLRERVGRRFFRIHSVSPAPAEPTQ